MHSPGSLPWYCHAIKGPNSTGVAPLIKTDKHYKWAFADARCHGPGGSMRVHHNLLVEVESGIDPTEHVRCSCAVFRNRLESKECVHTLYTRVNWDHLRSMVFSKEDEVVTKRNNSSTVGVTARCQRGSVLRSELHTCCRQIRSQAVADRERSTFTRSEVRF